MQTKLICAIFLLSHYENYEQAFDIKNIEMTK